MYSLEISPAIRELSHKQRVIMFKLKTGGFFTKLVWNQHRDAFLDKEFIARRRDVLEIGEVLNGEYNSIFNLETKS